MSSFEVTVGARREYYPTHAGPDPILVFGPYLVPVLEKRASYDRPFMRIILTALASVIKIIESLLEPVGVRPFGLG